MLVTAVDVEQKRYSCAITGATAAGTSMLVCPSKGKEDEFFGSNGLHAALTSGRGRAPFTCHFWQEKLAALSLLKERHMLEGMLILGTGKTEMTISIGLPNDEHVGTPARCDDGSHTITRLLVDPLIIALGS